MVMRVAEEGGSILFTDYKVRWRIFFLVPFNFYSNYFLGDSPYLVHNWINLHERLFADCIIEDVQLYSLLVVRECQRTHAAFASWKCIEEGEIESSPNFHDPFVSTGH